MPDAGKFDSATALREWIERHVRKRARDVLDIRHERYLGGDGSGAEDCTLDAVKRDLNDRFMQYVERPRPQELTDVIGAISELHTGSFDLRDHRPIHATDAERDAYEIKRADLINAWNTEWKKYTGIDVDDLPPSLSGASFNYKDLRGINLSNADLRQLDSLAGLGSSHDSANFSDAILSGANCYRNSFRGACLDGADLSGAYLVGAIFSGAKLRGANLSGADLRHANLTKADLTGAELRGADLTGAAMNRAILDSADLRLSNGLLVDQNSVYRTRFNDRGGIIWRAIAGVNWALESISLRLGWMSELDRTPKNELEDWWTCFRRIYTGPNFFISLLFLVTFTVPYVAKSVLLYEASRTELAGLTSLARLTGQDWTRLEIETSRPGTLQQHLPDEIAAFRTHFQNAALAAREAASKLAESTKDLDAVRLAQAAAAVAIVRDELETATTQAAQFRADFGGWLAETVKERRYPIWKILLGIDTGQYLWTLLICLLLAYNGAKWLLTTNIAPMRDAEDRSRVTPAKLEYQAYFRLHQLISWLFWLSSAVAVYSFLSLMTQPVYKFW